VIVHFEKSFLKDIKKLNDTIIASKLKTIIKKFEEIDSMNNLQNIKKLKGHSLYYRLKIGNYRLGFKVEGNQIEIIRFLHRKDIYRLFP